MKKFKKLRRVASIVAVCAVMTFAFSTNASALSVSDGIKAEITVDSQTDNSAKISAEVKNANYYAVDGINVKLTVSDNAKLDGETEKTDIALQSENSETLKANVSINEQEQEPTEDNTKPTVEPSTDAPSATQPTTNSVVLKNPDKTDSSSIKTGESGAALIAVFAVAVIALAMIFAFKRKNKRLLSIVLCFTITGSALVFALPANAAENELLTITDELVVNLGGQDVTLTFTVEYPQQAEIHDNSLAEIAKLNGKEPEVIYNDKGEISFLNGKFTDYKITNWETAFSALASVESIFNVKDQDVAVIELREQKNDNGDIYYTFQQMNGTLPIYNAVFTVGADKDGNALCISSSIDPQAGYVELEEDKNIIPAEKALEITKSMAAAQNLECVDSIPYLEITMANRREGYALCWVTYLKGKNEEGYDEYLKLFIDTTDGVVINSVITYTLAESGNNNEYNNEPFFDVETELMDFVAYDGRTVQLPVAKDGEGKYYLCDTQRKIIGADYTSTKFLGFLVDPGFYTFDTPQDLDPIFVSVFYNMMRVYDYYASVGIKSVDGKGMPILLRFDYRDPMGEKYENASFNGSGGGWVFFSFGQFPISSALDVVAHEYTHGVKHNITGDAEYQNTTGSIEESYADMLGNMTEMIVDPEHSDTVNWLVAESATPIRSMSNPHEYFQPEFIGDVYYLTDSEKPSDINDNGGVHANNSILSKICFDMSKLGISIEENFDIWRDTFFVFNPNADYDDVRAYAKYSLERNNHSELVDVVQNMFEKANAVDADKFSWENVKPSEGATKLNFVCKDMPENYIWCVGLRIGKKTVMTSEVSHNKAVVAVENGEYTVALKYQITDSEQPFKNYYRYFPQYLDENINLTGGEVTIEFSLNDLVEK